jgi:hypothetical protein
VISLLGSLSVSLGSLADRLIQWEKEHRVQRQAVASSSLEPLYQAIELVHADYTRSFANYFETVDTADGRDGCPEVFKKIELDMMLTSAIRTKVAKLRIQVLQPELREFRERVNGYLRCALRSHQLETYDNAPRLALSAELQNILRPGQQRDEDAARKSCQRARIAISRKPRQLDEKYGAVVSEYARLRIKLSL